MTLRWCFCLVLLLLAAPLHAQKPVWVFLEPAAVSAGELVAVPHRAALPNDRAIPLRIIESIERTGARVRYASRWLQAVSVDADAAAATRLRALKEVRHLQPVARMRRAAAATRGTDATMSSHRAAAADFDSLFYGPNWTAIRQLGIPPAHTLGFTGENVRIAILDTGFEPAHEALSSRRVVAQRDFIADDGSVATQPGDPNAGSPTLDQEIHGTRVWSILGGHAPGKVVGPAFDALFILAKVDLNQPGAEDVAADEDRWVAAVEWADSMGARIISSSIGYRDFIDQPDYPVSVLDGNTALSTRMADEAARRNILVVNAAGNLGPAPQSLWAPADADSIIAVGAVDALGVPLNSSSRGPTADGRLKPELVAVGTGISGARSSEPGGYDGDLEGTSFSTPFIAGIAAMFMEAWPNLTIMAVRNALLLSGTRSENANNDVGFGVPNVAGAILFPEGLTAAGITGVNLQNELVTIQPTFTWSAGGLVHPAMQPVRYRLEIASDPAFTNIVYTDTISTVTSLTVKQPLKPAPSLWWRVIAEAFPGIRRTTRSTAPFSVPDWVRLLTLNSPTPELTDSTRPVLRWEPMAAPPPLGPLSYDVQILNAQTGAPVMTLRNLSTASVQPPEPLVPNVAYRWRVIARTQTNVADTTESRSQFIVTSTTAPPVTLLYQNFPNPFPHADIGELSTRIWFDVNTTSAVELSIHDLRGRLIRWLIPAAPACGNIVLEPGEYGRSTAEPDPCIATSWDGRNSNGELVGRGVYLLRLRAGGTDQVKKIVFIPPE